MIGFLCECSKIGEWHAVNMPNDDWSAVDKSRDAFSKITEHGVFIVNTECVRATDKVLMSGDGWAIVEDMSED